MLKVQRADHTRASVIAVQRILNQTKKQTITLKDIISNPSEELLSKKHYMQSNEFLNDPHNVKMFQMGEDLVVRREKQVKNLKNV